MKTTVSKWACNFCGRTEDEVADLIVATFKLAICDECVATCTEIIAEAKKPPDVKVRVTISNAGQPVAESAREDAGLIPRSTIEAELRAGRVGPNTRRDSR
ncbi:ClpX C4-type zinc finger protein [Burkholderia vietnamiensis]|uniref:ClpX C4-type zinc finger protein n=1 Tax=Burkholderia vietnamiensis TaxID=60552 RepID=UPI002655CCBD|nr:ClpX C4-type zinc finger protein [Burkholderia vietnamiensis]MDN7413567.1 ClpX C4-type zinc finger protein [Burkholderia vietnamiensis]